MKSESKLISPHGGGDLKVLLLDGQEREEEIEKAKTLPQIVMTSRETGDLIMLGIGAFTPLDGFMGYEDWDWVCTDMSTASEILWPIPITLSHDKPLRWPGNEVCLVSGETQEIMGTMKVTESYKIEKPFECKNVFKTTDPAHPGVREVMQQKEWNIAGAVRVVSESYFPESFSTVYQRPSDSRKIFAERGWKTIAALQLRNPMHRGHEYIAKIATEISDGLYIHQLIGKLKADDLDAHIRVQCVDAVVSNYFQQSRVVVGGYPLNMRYAGPREALLHAIFRQNYGCTHMIIGRDHAGVGDYYEPLAAQQIFSELWDGALECQMIPVRVTFWCYKCGCVASIKTCPHDPEHRLQFSGTLVRQALLEEKDVPVTPLWIHLTEMLRPEALAILQGQGSKDGVR